MKPVSPVIPQSDAPEVVYAKDQPEYQPLPSIRTQEGVILTRWLLDSEEKRLIAEQGYIYLSIATFNHPLQPVLLTTDVPAEFAEMALPLKDEWPEEISEKAGG